MKFKVGNKVRVIGKSDAVSSYLGKVGEITEILHGDTYPYCVKFTNTERYEFYAAELEKVD